MSATPLVSVGLMVYNGGRFLRGTLDSLLSQTFTNFELIISDNCSTDDTSAICVEYAERDARIRYYRAERNMGAGWNTRRVLSLATAKYFKLAAHDDRCEPRFLERCVEALERDPALVLAYPNSGLSTKMESSSRIMTGRCERLSRDPKIRFHDLLLNDHLCLQFFGVIRLAALHNLPPPGSYVNSDGVILAQLGLLGRSTKCLRYFSSAPGTAGNHPRLRPLELKVKGFRLTRRHGTLPCPEWSGPFHCEGDNLPGIASDAGIFSPVGYGIYGFRRGFAAI